MTHPTIQARTSGPQTRVVEAAALRAKDQASGREFTGIAVPWDTIIDVWGFRENFAAGSIEPVENVLICYRHDEPIGVVTDYRDTDEGWQIDGRLSETSAALDAATLLRDGVIRKLSIGFEPLEWTEAKQEDGTIVLTHTRARVFEVSLVPFPAYDTAAITAVRHKPTTPTSAPEETHTMPETMSRQDGTELRQAVDELTRRVETMHAEGAPAAPAHPLSEFRSMGEYVKAVARGDDKALRAYEGLTLGEVSPAEGAPSWAGQLVKMIEAKTPTVNAFLHTKDLPAQGNHVEYGQLRTANGLRVAEQLAEGDDLVFGKLTIDTKGLTAPVRTIGGWTDMSRQSIERSPLNVIDLMWRGFSIRYAEALEAIASRILADTYAAQLAAGGAATMTADLTTVNGLIDFVIDASTRYAQTAYSLDAVWVAPDVFKAMAKIDAQPKALQIIGAPTDKLGTLDVKVPGADVGPLTFKLWENGPAGAAFAADAQAIHVQESPGAPFRLQDENIVNLTKQFSVYGYVAAFAEMPEAIVPVVAATA